MGRGLGSYRLIGLWILLATFWVIGKDDGQATGLGVAEKEFPSFARAVVRVLGSERAESFFSGWAKADVLYYRNKQRHLLSMRNRGEDSLLLYRKYSLEARSTFAEAFGAVEIQKRYRERNPTRPAQFLNEIQYVEWNKQGRKPDGLLYYIENKELIIVGVLEGKFTQRLIFDQAQARSYLGIWKDERHGISIHGTLYRPHQIFIEPPSRPRIPIGDVSHQHLETLTLVVGRQPLNWVQAKESFQESQYSYIQAPFASWFRRLTAELIAEVSDTANKMGAVQQMLTSDLERWVYENGRWPRNHGLRNLEEIEMARLVSALGGRGRLQQSVAFQCREELEEAAGF